MLSHDQIEQARQVNILALVSRHTTLKRVAATGGGEFAGPCPVCGGTDRFHVQPGTHRWFCRRCTGGPEEDGWKDAIDLQMRLSGETFPQAVQSLIQESITTAPHLPTQTPQITKTSGPPGEQWQKRAWAVIERGIENIWGRAGSLDIEWQETDPGSGETRAVHISPMNWLLERGLEPATLQAAQVGYNPKNWNDNPAHWGLEGAPILIPQGILMPSQASKILWNLKIRRPLGRPKYIQVRGGRPAIYQADTLLSAPEAACIVEGEFDALLLRQCLQRAANLRWRDLGVITLGSNSNYPALERWARYLYPVKYFLLLYDQDGKSQPAIRFWEGLSARTRVVEWRNIRPHDKDLTDYHRSGGRLLDLISWALMQIEYERLVKPLVSPAPMLLFEPALPLERAAQLAAILSVQPARTPQKQVVILSIEQTAEYIRANGLRVKSVTWPKGEPRPILELE